MTPLLIAASLITAFAIGVLLTGLLLPGIGRGPAPLLFHLAAGGGLGLGVASCLHFLCLLAGVERAAPAVDLLVCLLLGLAFWTIRGPRAARNPVPPADLEGTGTAPASWLDRLVAWVFSLGLAGSAATFAMTAIKDPQGRWDAWLIWNMHARFIYRSGAHWREAFASGLDWSMWEYPLLLPLSIARGWTYAGREEILLPVVMGFLFTFLTLGLLMCALWLLRERTQGSLAALLLMGSPFFLVMGAAQFADLPLAFFILATIVMLVLQSRSQSNRPGALALAGLAAGLAAWTKNEGVLFLLAAAGSLIVITARREGWRPSLRSAISFSAGALPVLLIVLHFKLTLAPTDVLLSAVTPADLVEKLLTWERYTEISRAFFLTGLSFTQGLVDIRAGMRLNPGAVNILLPVAYLLLAGVHGEARDRAGLFMGAAVLALMTAGYFFVYVLTPLDLTYHLVTSLNRLFLQLWPGFLFLIFMTAGSPLPAALRGAPSGDGPSRRVPGTAKKYAKETR